MPNVAKDLTGVRFGRLVVLDRVGTKNGKPLWRCECDCGNIHDVSSTHLLRGSTKSCGCYRPDHAKELHTKHNGKGTRLYRIYTGVRTRCFNKNDHAYARYGASGISICKEWDGADGFERFRDWAMNNGYSDNLTLDRIDNAKGYQPDNCRWVSMKAQERNRTNNRYLTANGETHIIAEWSDITGIKQSMISQRLYHGWTPEEALGLAERRKRATDR